VQRSLYEVRERPSKAYSWKAFIISNMIVELPWQVACSIVTFFPWYYTVGFYQNAINDSLNERGALMYLYILAFFIFASTFAQMVIAGLPDAETGGSIATLMFSLSLTFNGVLQPPSALPGFWIFMYRLSPFTYMMGMLPVGLQNAAVYCSSTEVSTFFPPAGETCQRFAGAFAAVAGGAIYDPTNTTVCQYCSLTSANQYLATVDLSYSDRWRDFGIFCAYIVFNVFGAVTLYYFARVHKWKGASIKARTSKIKNGAIVVGNNIRRVCIRRNEEGTELKRPGVKQLF